MSRNRRTTLALIAIGSFSLLSCRKEVKEVKPKTTEETEVVTQPKSITGTWYAEMTRIRANNPGALRDTRANEKYYDPWAGTDDDSLLFREITLGEDKSYLEKRHFVRHVVEIKGTWSISYDSVWFYVNNTHISNLNQLTGIHPSKVELWKDCSSPTYKVENKSPEGIELSYTATISGGSRGGGGDEPDSWYDFVKYRIYLTREKPPVRAGEKL